MVNRKFQRVVLYILSQEDSPSLCPQGKGVRHSAGEAVCIPVERDDSL